MGPAMPPVTALMVIVPCVAVILVPALLCHAWLRNYWLASGVIWLLSFACGYSVASIWRFPVEHVAFGAIASVIGLATGLVVGIPFVLYRRGWLVGFWTRIASAGVLAGDVDQRRRGQRTAAMLGFWFIGGFIAALATWLAQEPVNRDSSMFCGVLALGFIVFFSGNVFTLTLGRWLKPRTGKPRERG